MATLGTRSENYRTTARAKAISLVKNAAAFFTGNSGMHRCSARPDQFFNAFICFRLVCSLWRLDILGRFNHQLAAQIGVVLLRYLAGLEIKIQIA